MKSTVHSPEEYTISVRKEIVDGMSLWVARVAEIPDIQEFGEDRDSAYDSALYTIRVGQEMCREQGTNFPEPLTFSEPVSSGRITLRLKKSTHAQALLQAEAEGVSLNAFISSCVEQEISRTTLQKIDGKINSLLQIINGMSASQNTNLTLITRLVSQHVGTMTSRVRFDAAEQMYDHKKTVHRFLINQDSSYVYD